MMPHCNASTPKGGRWMELDKKKKLIINWKQIVTYPLRLTYQNRKLGENNTARILIRYSPPTNPNNQDS